LGQKNNEAKKHKRPYTLSGQRPFFPVWRWKRSFHQAGTSFGWMAWKRSTVDANDGNRL